MNTVKKTFIIVAVACVLLGTVISFGAFAKTGFDINAFTITSPMQENSPIDGTADNSATTHVGSSPYATSYEIQPEPNTGEFSSISIDTDECDVKFEVSDDGQCRVKVNDIISNDIVTKVEVVGDELRVVRKNETNWLRRIGDFGYINMTIMLPKSEYDKLTFNGASAGISIPENFTIGNADIISVSGDVAIKGNVTQELSIKTTSGDIAVSNVAAKDEVSAKTVSGEVILHSVTAYEVEAETTSGDVTMNDVVSSGEIDVETLSGDIALNACDADKLKLKSTSGDIYAMLLTGKKFIAHTVSGDSIVPNSTSDKTCTASTTSGDIFMRVKEY